MRSLEDEVRRWNGGEHRFLILAAEADRVAADNLTVAAVLETARRECRESKGRVATLLARWPTMPDVWERLEISYERFLAARSEYEQEQPRPAFRLMPTGVLSGDPLVDRLTAAVDALEPRGVAPRRPDLVVVQGGRDDA